MSKQSEQDRIEILCTYLGVTGIESSAWRAWKGIANIGIPSMADFDLCEPLWQSNDDRAGVPMFMPIHYGLDVSFVTRNLDTGIPAFRRVRILTPKEARGYGGRYARWIMRQWGALVDAEGTCREGWTNAYSVSQDGRNWRAAFWPGHANDDDNQIECVAAGIEWRRDRTWRVGLGFDSAPRIDLETSATGVRELFALRDIPNGRKRRAALRHWVTAHWRKKSTATEDATWVRQHLRGAEEFTWNGMRGRIRVPTQAAEAEIAANDLAYAQSISAPGRVSEGAP